MDLLVNNEPVDSENITLEPNENTTVEFSHTADEPGTYTIEVGGQTESYEVTEEAPFLSGIATLGILATAFVVLRKRRK